MPKRIPTILIVESDPPTLQLYQRALSSYYEVLACANETEALTLLQTRELQAVVLEPAIYGGRGWALLAAIKARSPTQFVPVILCTILDERKRALEMGASACLVKPVLPTTLLQTLRKVTQTELS
jgi:DNA-binding response OmpR family regulator